MNHTHTLKKAVILLLSLAALFQLTACQPEEPVQPVPASREPDPAAARLNLEAASYLLTRFDSRTLTYDAAGQLTQVTFSPSTYGSYERTADGSYDYITANTYSGGKLMRREVYRLNAQGRCTQSHISFFNPSTGVVTQVVPYKYEYNAQAKLIKFYNVANPKEQQLFTYSANGNLKMVQAYSGQNGLLYRTTKYGYNLLSPADLYRFNPDRVEKMDFHLRVFGTFFTQLPAHCEVDDQNPITPAEKFFYSYELNPAGYPIRRHIDDAAGVRLGTQSYKYQLYQAGL